MNEGNQCHAPYWLSYLFQMLLAIPILVLHLVLLPGTLGHTGGAHHGNTGRVGEKETGRAQVPIATRAPRTYRRSDRSKRLNIPARQSFTKATKNTLLNDKTTKGKKRISSRSALTNSRQSTYRSQKKKQTNSLEKTKSKVRDDPTRKQYSGVQIPKLNLFPKS